MWVVTVEDFDRWLEVQDRIHYFLSDQKYSETSADHFHMHLLLSLSLTIPPQLLLIYSGPYMLPI